MGGTNTGRDAHGAASKTMARNTSVLLNAPRGRICNARLRRMSADRLTADVNKKADRERCNGYGGT